MSFWVDNNEKYWRIVQRCWKDEAFKKKYLLNPRKILENAAIDLPPSAKIVVKDGSTKIKWNSNHKMVLPLPPKPEDYCEDKIGDAAREVVFCCCD